MWLDGIYMASPFYAEYAKLFGEDTSYNDVVRQISVVTKHTRDSVTNLMYHGWDSTKTMAWANKTTGASKTFWGRAMGWYMMALVDILDDLPSTHAGRASVLTAFQNLAKGIKTYQDPLAGTWYEVVDQGSRAYNYHECSASCIFTYALAKGYRMGYLDSTYYTAAQKGYTGILNSFIRLNADSTLQIDSICKTASLTYTTSDTNAGSYAYYTGQTLANSTITTTVLTSNEGKGIGPFMMASVEMERLGFVVAPQSVTATYDSTKKNVTIKWTDKAPNARTWYVERKASGESNYTIITQVNKGVYSALDTPKTGGVWYSYRVRAKSDSVYSGYSNIDSAYVKTAATGITTEQTGTARTFALLQNYPNPFNPTTTISFTLAKDGFTTLKIFDVLGREVATLVNGEMKTGVVNTATWNASKLASGVYFSRLESSGTVQLKKLVLLK
jgi:hypothetical protein